MRIFLALFAFASLAHAQTYPAKPIHVLVPSGTARGIVNLSALAALEARSG